MDREKARLWGEYLSQANRKIEQKTVIDKKCCEDIAHQISDLLFECFTCGADFQDSRAAFNVLKV